MRLTRERKCVCELNHMADMELNELCGVGDPDWDFCCHEDDITSTDEDTDHWKEEKIEFEKWAKQHGRKYSSEEERTSRFRIFLGHKRVIDQFVKANRCSCSTGGYDVDDSLEVGCITLSSLPGEFYSYV